MLGNFSVPSSVVGSFSREVNERQTDQIIPRWANKRKTNCDRLTHTHTQSDTRTDRLKAYWDRKTERQMDRPTKADRGKQIDWLTDWQTENAEV